MGALADSRLRSLKGALCETIWRAGNYERGCVVKLSGPDAARRVKEVVETLEDLYLEERQQNKRQGGGERGGDHYGTSVNSGGSERRSVNQALSGDGGGNAYSLYFDGQPNHMRGDGPRGGDGLTGRHSHGNSNINNGGGYAPLSSGDEGAAANSNRFGRRGFGFGFGFGGRNNRRQQREQEQQQQQQGGGGGGGGGVGGAGRGDRRMWRQSF